MDRDDFILWILTGVRHRFAIFSHKWSGRSWNWITWLCHVRSSRDRPRQGKWWQLSSGTWNGWFWSKLQSSSHKFRDICHYFQRLRSAWSKFDWSKKFKMFLSLAQQFLNKRSHHTIFGLCCHIGYTVWIWPHQPSVCFVQWRMRFVDKSLWMITRLWWTWLCGFSRHHKTSTNMEDRPLFPNGIKP